MFSLRGGIQVVCACRAQQRACRLPTSKRVRAGCLGMLTQEEFEYLDLQVDIAADLWALLMVDETPQQKAAFWLLYEINDALYLNAVQVLFDRLELLQA